MIRSGKFLNEFIRNRREIGSVTPSWPLLVKKMSSAVDYENAKVVVELGAGEGVITRHLLKSLNPNAKVLLFELNGRFADLLRRIPDERLIVINGSAENLHHHLKVLGLPEADAVLSSLPLSNMPEEVESAVMQSVQRALKPGGVFMQYHYHGKRHSHLEAQFNEVKESFVFWNMPPAFVYRCVKGKSASAVLTD